jgi:hypothetical protein
LFCWREDLVDQGASLLAGQTQFFTRYEVKVNPFSRLMRLKQDPSPNAITLAWLHQFQAPITDMAQIDLGIDFGLGSLGPIEIAKGPHGDHLAILKLDTV